MNNTKEQITENIKYLNKIRKKNKIKEKINNTNDSEKNWKEIFLKE